MKKRIISVALLVTMVLVVGIIIGWLLSQAGQVWSRSWLGRPDGLTATATVLAGIGTVGAVIVALFGIQYERKRAQEERVEAQKRFEDAQEAERKRFIAERDEFLLAQEESQNQFIASQKQTQEALEEGRRQYLEAQYAVNRPLIVPGQWMPISFNGNPPISINWFHPEQPVEIKNEGAGLATDVWGVLMPLNSVQTSHSLYLCRLRSPIPGKEKKEPYFQKVDALLNCSDRVTDRDNSTNSYALGAQGSISEENYGTMHKVYKFIARLTLTYHDIFGRKQASIFDYTDMGDWVCIAFFPNIEQDIREMIESKDTVSKGGIA